MTKFAYRRLRRLPDGTMGVIFIDTATGLPVADLTGYTIITAGNTGSLSTSFNGETGLDAGFPTGGEPTPFTGPEQMPYGDATLGGGIDGDRSPAQHSGPDLFGFDERWGKPAEAWLDRNLAPRAQPVMDFIENRIADPIARALGREPRAEVERRNYEDTQYTEVMSSEEQRQRDAWEAYQEGRRARSEALRDSMSVASPQSRVAQGRANMADAIARSQGYTEDSFDPDNPFGVGGTIDPSFDPTYTNPNQRTGLKPGMEDIARQVGLAWDETANVNSGYRSPEYNASIRAAGNTLAAKNSEHMAGTAIDIGIRGQTDREKQQAVQEALQAGANNVISYTSGNHLHFGKRNYANPSYATPDMPHLMHDGTKRNLPSAPEYMRELDRAQRAGTYAQVHLAMKFAEEDDRLPTPVDRPQVLSPMELTSRARDVNPNYTPTPDVIAQALSTTPSIDNSLASIPEISYKDPTAPTPADFMFSGARNVTPNEVEALASVLATELSPENRAAITGGYANPQQIEEARNLMATTMNRADGARRTVGSAVKEGFDAFRGVLGNESQQIASANNATYNQGMRSFVESQLGVGAQQQKSYTMDHNWNPSLVTPGWSLTDLRPETIERAPATGFHSFGDSFKRFDSPARHESIARNVQSAVDANTTSRTALSPEAPSVEKTDYDISSHGTFADPISFGFETTGSFPTIDQNRDYTGAFVDSFGGTNLSANLGFDNSPSAVASSNVSRVSDSRRGISQQDSEPGFNKTQSYEKNTFDTGNTTSDAPSSYETSSNTFGDKKGFSGSDSKNEAGTGRSTSNSFSGGLDSKSGGTNKSSPSAATNSGGGGYSNSSSASSGFNGGAGTSKSTSSKGSQSASKSSGSSPTSGPDDGSRGGSSNSGSSNATNGLDGWDGWI